MVQQSLSKKTGTLRDEPLLLLIKFTQPSHDHPNSKEYMSGNEGIKVTINSVESCEGKDL